jgi:hypothetical protein
MESELHGRIRAKERQRKTFTGESFETYKIKTGRGRLYMKPFFRLRPLVLYASLLMQTKD